ncbi:MAG: trypsin-like peptidase domain-containing protein [Treponema sp.]|jgi:S1-C subfamily serine protease|nr:trypsin-like peptidase domain-containing protein [Treponema sp.]
MKAWHAVAFFFLSIGSLCLLACVSSRTLADRLVLPKPAREIRLADIENAISENPAQALHLIGVYRAHYPQDNETNDKLAGLWDAAVRGLKTDQAKALEEKRFDDAASMARSLVNLNVAVESTGMEPDILLAGAKDKLENGDDLSAFITAVHAHTLKPLAFDDALIFLSRAVLVKQRRTASYFLAAADAAAGSADKRAEIPADVRAYAEGTDQPRDMIKGVATVLVDQGTHIERGRAYPAMTLGSAFFVDASGLLITNYHVVQSEVDPAYEGYSRVYIRMGDAASPRVPAKVVGYDKAMDLALIKASVTPEYVFSIADWAAPAVGDPVIAIGSPVGLEKTVTQGIVSAMGRRLLQIGGVIQIDAAVNHGNSGGPVLDRNGRLVGVVFAGADQYQGLNFAIPAERLVAALPALIKGGKAARPWLGLALAETAEGAEIIYVAPFTPAAEMNVKEGSVIAYLNGEKMNASQGGLIPALQDALFSTRPGELVSLETTDGARYLLMSHARSALPLSEAAKKDSRERMTGPLFGFILAPSLGKTSTYTVKKVIRGSIADDAGLSKDDPIIIRGFSVMEKEGYVFMDIDVKKRRLGYMETSMRLPAYLDTPDTL